MMFSRLRKIFRRAVLFNDLHRTEPISSVFGLDRGTPIDRYYIERFLSQQRSLIRGRVAEVGDNTYTRLYGTGVTRSEVLQTTTGSGVTLVADLTDIATLPSGDADCFICTQTLNFIYDVPAAVRGIHHLLAPGGTLLATVAGISQISRYDMGRWGDYWRFTTASLTQLFAALPWDDLQIESHGNVLAATAFLQGIAVEDLPERKLLDENDTDYQVILTVVARKRG
jgi:hypothetical protein